MIKQILASFVLLSSAITLADNASDYKDKTDSLVEKQKNQNKGIDISMPIEAKVDKNNPHNAKGHHKAVSSGDSSKQEEEYMEHKRHQRSGVKDSDSRYVPNNNESYNYNRPEWDSAGRYVHGRSHDIKNSVKKHQELGTVNKWSPVKNAD